MTLRLAKSILFSTVLFSGCAGVNAAEGDAVTNVTPKMVAQQPPATSVSQSETALSQTSETRSLAQLEQTALLHNPTLLQAQALERAARARARQAAMLPNPIVGFEGVEWSFRGFRDKAEHFGYFEQQLPLGGKLAKSRQIYLRQAEVAAQQAAAQRYRVLNELRAAFYDTLAAQQMLDLRTQLAGIAYEAVATTSQLFNVGQADRPDYLEAQVEAEQVAHQLVVAQNDLRQSWQNLAAVMGTPDAPFVRLEGRLEDRVAQFNQTELLGQILQQSPELRAQEAQVARARAVLARARVEPIPDLFLRGALGYSQEFLDTGGDTDAKPRRTGMEAAIQVGVTLPLWNRNQGGIAAAAADVAYAENELQRLRLGIRVRLAQAIRDYNNRIDAIRRYQTIILPKAEEAYRLYLAKFRQMSASYPQVLIAQRTMIQVREQYISALAGVRQTGTQLEGFLLSGGLDAPQSANETRVQISTVRAGAQEDPTFGQE